MSLLDESSSLRTENDEERLPQTWPSTQTGDPQQQKPSFVSYTQSQI